MDTILVVEDNRDARAVYRLLLEHNGFRVIEARNGKDAVQRAVAEGPDAILMDLSMPVLDGWDAAGQLRDRARTAGIPIVACTASVSETEVMASGLFDAFLSKPADPNTVMAALRDVMERA